MPESGQGGFGQGGLTSKVWNGVELSASYKEKLQAFTAEAARMAFSRYVSEAMAPMIADLDKRIRERMDSEMQVRLQVLAKEALRGALK